jgi:hypothetical protein
MLEREARAAALPGKDAPMLTGTWTMACLVAAASVGAPDAVHLNQRSFQIPLRIEEARRAEIKQLILWASLDGGKAWDQVATVSPDKEAFNYYAPADGLYLFKVQVEDQQGRKQPSDIFQAPVGQRIMVDTLRPQIQILAAERQGDEIVVRWEIREDNPDLQSLRLEYRTADAPAEMWTPVNLTPALTSQASFKASGSTAISVRLQFADLAGNSSTATAEVLSTAGSAAGGGSPVMKPSNPSDKDRAWAPTQPVSLSKTPPDLNDTPRPLTKPQPELPDAVPPTSPSAAVRTGTSTFDAAPLPGTGGSGNQLVASSNTKVNTSESPASSGGTHTSRGDLPRLQIVNSSKVTLEYQVNKFGPSGVGSVELYVTRDDGQKWERYGEGQNLNIPIPADARGTTNSVQRSLTVTLPGEGTYGFYLVVKSGAGLGKPPPKDGVTLPQMRIEVDETAPQANLFAPIPDPQQKDCLILSWTATDRNLAEKPITLQWAERANGPWETIGAPELPNTGRFSWKLTSQVPPHVYLRLVVRDTAGNMAEAVTPQPILVDLNEPEAQFIGLSGASR